MRVLIVGSGGREHALAWKLAQSPLLTELHAAPGNPGIARLATCHQVGADDHDGLVDLARTTEADLAFVGPEAPLVAGLADRLREAGVDVFGPSAAAAQIEGSKSFAKDVMAAAGVPTARILTEPVAPCVVKADGLAAGKGVFVCPTERDVEEALPKAETLGGPVFVEELLAGEEVSLFAITDGDGTVVPLVPAQDSKRLLDGDKGPNTGGMGSYAPFPGLSRDDVAELAALVHRPVLDELAARGTPYSGLLYAGLMLTEDGPRVLEFNCRFGDPETQAILPLLDGDLLPVLAQAAAGRIDHADLPVSENAAVTVVLASAGYPAAPESGATITGIEDAEASGALVFHAGTAARGDRLESAGGRVLNVSAIGSDVGEAREAAYRAIERIDFPGSQHRRDIGAKAVRVSV